jgi:TPP-dependent indolepyruvate ferredoxin oxidoreductase alpha subunit
MQDYKVYAALHYCRVNQLNQIVIDSPKPRLGIITSGKSYLDVRQAWTTRITEADAGRSACASTRSP